MFLVGSKGAFRTHQEHVLSELRAHQEHVLLELRAHQKHFLSPMIFTRICQFYLRDFPSVSLGVYKLRFKSVKVWQLFNIDTALSASQVLEVDKMIHKKRIGGMLKLANYMLNSQNIPAHVFGSLLFYYSKPHLQHLLRNFTIWASPGFIGPANTCAWLYTLKLNSLQSLEILFGIYVHRLFALKHVL